MYFEERYETRQQLWLDGPHGGWLAFDRVLGRDVVLNIPYCPEDNRRFIRTAQFRARLRHANLIPLLDFNVTRAGQPYFTDPHLEALDLRESLRAGADGTLWDQCRILLQVCDAVRYVHANDLLHLDLQPRNVLVTRSFQEVFLIRIHSSLPAADIRSEEDSQSAVIIGNPAYMAPEQLDPARSGRATAETDVYGLGGILYFMLYGTAPNQGHATPPNSILEALAKRLGPPSPDLGHFKDSVSRRLAKRLSPICERALHSDRERRHETVREFYNELLAAMAP
ncbi:MAG: serine/threonine-protein kinase [Pirellulales bacterium]